MQVIDQINGSALFAQSAYSASIATKDSLGQDITATYLTGINIPESANWNDTTNVVQTNSATWGQGGGEGDAEVNALVHTNSSTWNEVTNKLDTSAQVVTGYTTASIEGNPLITTLNGSSINAYRAVSAQEAGVADKARYDYEGNNLVDEHNRLTALNDVVQSNSAQWAEGGSIPVSNSGDLYKVEFDGIDLYGLKSTSSTPNYVYSAVSSSRENGQIIYTQHPNFNNCYLDGILTWSAFDIISISSNGVRIYPPEYGDYNVTALDVYFKASYLYDYNNNELDDFSGYIGKITLDNLFITSYFDKPSYYNNIYRGDIRLWFSGNQGQGALESNYICSVGNKVQSGTNMISGIIVPGAVDLTPYATTAEVDTLSSMLSGAIDYVSANAGGTLLTGDAQGAVDNVYTNSSKYVLNNANGVYIGNDNTATLNGFAQGGSNKAESYAFAQGLYNKATGYSIAQGQFCTASDLSIAQGAGNSADVHSQAFGSHTKANNSGMAIGTYNNITTGAFVIGNGDSNQRSDCFIIDHDGNVSACGKISANGVELGAGGEFPISADEAVQYVQTNSGTIDEVNANVTTNSGAWGGNALPISAGPGVKINFVNNTLVFSNDETVLFENWESPIRSTTATGSLSEPLTSFDSFEITWAPWGNRGELRWEPITQKFQSYPASNSASYYTLFAPWIVENNQGMYWFMELLSADDTNFCIKEGKFYQFRDTVTSENTSIDNSKIYKIVGINRK